MRYNAKAPSAGSSRAARTAARWALALLSIVLLAPAAALAGETHLFQRDLGASAFLANPLGVAVDAGSQDVYATDSTNGLLDRFERATGGLAASFGAGGQLNGSSTPKGSFASLYGVAVDPSTGDVYVADSGHGVVDKFTGSGELVSSFGDTLDGEGKPAPNGQLGGLKTPVGSMGPAGLAVDPSSHDLYVADRSNSVIDVFTSGGEYVSQISTPGPQGSIGLYGPVDVAVDTKGHVYVAGSGFTERYNAASGEPEARVDSGDQYGGSNAVAVDPSSDDVYVGDGSSIVQRASAEAGSPNAEIATFGHGKLQSVFALAVNAAGDVLAADDYASQLVEFGPLLTVNPPVLSNLQVSAITDHSAQFSATVNSGGSGEGYETTYSYSLRCSPYVYGCPERAGEQSIPADGADHVVQEQAEGLWPAQEYILRITAKNAGGETSVQQTFKTVTLPPTVTTEPGEDIAAIHASLQGTVSPHNAPTTYWFEYGTDTGYGTSIPASQDATTEIREPDGLNGVAIPIYRLTPGTVYHYRIAAHDSAGTVYGEDRSFTTNPPAAAQSCPNAQRRSEQHSTSILSGCRAWEMVSPLDKNGGEVGTDTKRFRAANHEALGLPMAVAFYSFTAFGDAQASGVATEYLAQRTGEPGTQGWSYHSITPPHQVPVTLLDAFQGGGDPGYWAYSEDLTHGVFQSAPFSPLTEAPNVEKVGNLYSREGLRSAGPGSYTLLSNSSSPLSPSIAPTYFAAASNDYSHVLFASVQSLTSDVAPCTPGQGGRGCSVHLYESVNGVTRLVGLVPPAGATSCGAGGLACVPAVSSDAGAGAYLPFSLIRDTSRTLSTDGSRVFFTDMSKGGSEVFQNTGALYMYDDHGTETTADDTVTQINASERSGKEGTSDAAEFWAASTDGSRAFFRDSAALTNDAPIGGLYMWSAQPDSNGHHLRLIAGESVQGVIGASADGHYVYFISAGGQLVPGKPSVNEAIYVWHDETGTPKLDYVGSLPENVQFRLGTSQFLNLQIQFGQVQARVTPDGKHLLFASTTGRGLTGFDQESACTHNILNDTESGCTELYVYSVDGVGPNHVHLQCASCLPSGRPATQDTVNTFTFAQGGGYRRVHGDRAISDDGRYVFFTSADPLVPEDTNGEPDAYVFETETGEVHLLSSGEDRGVSFFVESSADGRDAFFVTHQSLVGWDIGSALDLYDARVDGGFPEPVRAPASCQGDACQPPAVSLNDATPSSASFNGAENASLQNSSHRAVRRKTVHKHHRAGKHRRSIKHRKARANRGGSK